MTLLQALETIKSEFPTVEDFERDFPSLCFALATGVGKTRLMGAFISYLHLSEGIRHFFVLAPNLTIYNKLIADFTPNTPKYVFQGISDFAVNPPEIITGDNYESGRGIRGSDLFGNPDSIHVNIFNISKINSEVRGGKEPTHQASERIHRAELFRLPCRVGRPGDADGRIASLSGQRRSAGDQRVESHPRVGTDRYATGGARPARRALQERDLQLSLEQCDERWLS